MQMCVDEAEAAQTLLPQGIVGHIGDEDAPLITDNHILHFAETVGEDPYLAPEITGEIGQLPAQVKGDQVANGDPAAVKPLQRFDLARL
jgi:hypothetical protein